LLKRNCFIILISMFLLVVWLIIPLNAYAEYNDGDCIFVEDLPIRSILAGFTVTTQNVGTFNCEAIVTIPGNSPRLVLLNSVRDNVNYSNARWHIKLGSYSFSIGDHVTNITLPNLIDVGMNDFENNNADLDNEYLIPFKELVGSYWLNNLQDNKAVIVSSERIRGVYEDFNNDVRVAFNLKPNTVVKYNSGKFVITTNPTDISKAFTAKYGNLYTETINAKNAANSANTNAANALNMLNGSSNGGKSLAATYDKANAANSNAYAAKNNAATASSRVWDSVEGKSAATLSKEARDKANAASQDTTYIRNTQLPGIATDVSQAKTAADAAKVSADTAATKATAAADQTIYNGNSAAYWAYVAYQNTGTDTIAPVITKVEGQNGATCTTGTSFTVVITASDNGPAGNLRYRVTCGGFDSGWTSSNTITITGLSTGAKTATIKVSDNPSSPDNGNVAQTSYTFFKI